MKRKKPKIKDDFDLFVKAFLQSMYRETGIPSSLIASRKMWVKK